ncbi:MAG: hypothetical protein NTU41_05035 [Chloroflexi bacterium]|nr:hypothetical protein [Chloroflexota bacterium]
MEWEFIVAITLAVPIIVLPAALWYLNAGGFSASVRRERKKHTGSGEKNMTEEEEREGEIAGGMRRQE